jgi:hypothetical protein
MMKAANAGQPDNLGLRRRGVLGGSPDREIPKPSVDSVGVVVIDVFAQQAMQMPFVHDDHMIEKLPADASHPSLGNPVLPRTQEGRSAAK